MQVDRYVAERRRKQKTRRKYFWGVAGFLVLYFVVLGIFFFIVRSPAFQVEKINIEGTSEVSTSTVMSLLQASIINKGFGLAAPHDGWNAMLGFGNMLIWPDALPTSTIAVVPRLAGVTISKNYFLHTINVTATERTPFAVWCVMPNTASASDERCFWFDSQGIAFANTLDTEGGAILVIHDYAQDQIALNGPVLSSEFLSNLISIVNVVKASGLDVQEIALHDISLQQIDVTTVGGPVIYFSLRFSPNPDLAVLRSVMVKPGFNKLQYIDFTVQGRAYYK